MSMKNLKRYTTRSIGLGLAAAICVTGINVTPLLEGREALAYGYMYGGEIGIYYSNKKPSKNRWYKAAKKMPARMEYTLYDKKTGKRLYSVKMEKTWWKNGFVFQPKTGYYNKKNLRMKSTVYFYHNTIGNQQMKAFESGQTQLEHCKVTHKRNTHTFIVDWK